MSRVIAFCFLLLASVLGYLHIDSRPIWAPFASDSLVGNTNQPDDSPESTEFSKPVKNLKNTADRLVAGYRGTFSTRRLPNRA